MQKRIISLVLMMALSISGICGCGNKAEEVAPAAEQVENTAAEEETENESESDFSELEAIGDVDVDKGLFNVTLNVPKDFIGETTQEELDKTAKEKGYKSATLNDDGSVTYVITKEQHKEMLEAVKKSIDESLAEMIGSEEYPNVTNVTANSDYTSFTITTKNAEPDFSESLAVISLYMFGGMYGVFSGERVDNVHVDFVNDASGDVISSSDSKNMGSDDE